MAARSVIPGTVHLVDLQGTLAVKHAGGNLDDVVLVPAPSNDPDDPLNWSPRRKLLSTVSLVVYLLMIGLAVSCVYSIIVPISQDTGLTVAGNQSIDIRHRKDADLRLRSQFWNWLSISIDGLGLLVMVNLSPSGQVSLSPKLTLTIRQPTAQTFGKRPVYLLSLLLSIVSDLFSVVV